jgi:ABC-type dipeptide/oligopeptide/nickel transport system ATPase component
MLLVTHDLGFVSALCDRVLVLHAGELVEEGPLPATFERPGHEQTRRLLARQGPGVLA